METLHERLGSAARRTSGAQPAARGLGWLSLGLGLPQVVLPGLVTRLIGAGGASRSRALVRIAGGRELASGASILLQRDPEPGVWGRVAGDAMDIGLLTAGLFSRDARRGRLLLALAAVGGITAADVRTARRLRSTPAEGSGRVVASTTINRPRQEVYDYWRDLSRLPTFMAHLQRVEVDGDRSHWVARSPLGGNVEWDARVVDDLPGEAISWRSEPGSPVRHSGRVEFSDAPGDRGTEVTVLLEYETPLGGLGQTLAKLTGEEPRQQVTDDLRRFKQVLETGEVVRSEGSPQGILARQQLRQHVAQPLSPEQARRAA